MRARWWRAAALACAVVHLSLTSLARVSHAADGGDTACLVEHEPNDRAPDAPAAAGAFCLEGALGERDQDLVAWTVPTGPGGAAAWAIQLEGVYGQTSRVVLHRLERGADGAAELGSELYGVSTPDGGSTARADSVLLRPGTYLLAVLASAPGPYRLHVGPAAAPAQREAEPDDDPAHAAPFAPRTLLSGDLAGSEDFLRFTITPGDARRRFDLELNGAIDDWIRAEILRPGGQALVSYSDRFKGPATLPDLAFDAGDYLLHLAAPTPAPSTPYTVRLVAGGPRTPSREEEPNDTLAVAKPLLVGTPLSGHIARPGDTDVFAIDPDPRFTGKRLEVDVVSESDKGQQVCLVDAKAMELQCRRGTRVLLPDLALGASRFGVSIWGPVDPRHGYLVTLRVAGEDRAGFENEPNDKAAIATAMDPRQPMSGRLVGDDTDLFRIRVDGAPQLWAFTARGRGVASLVVLDDRGGRLGSGAVPPTAEAVSAADVFLLPGDYWIELTGKDADYVLSAAPTGAPDPGAEREPNDDDRQAQRLAYGVTRRGKLADVRDRDCYRFSLAAPGHVALEVKPPPGGALNLEVEWGYPSVKKPYATTDLAPLVYDAWLEPGDYMVRLTTEKPSPASYELTLRHRDPFELSDDLEPNDTPPQAHPLPATLSVTGDVGRFHDDDWYTLPVVDHPAALTVKVSGAVEPRLSDAGKPFDGTWHADTHVLEVQQPAGRPIKLGVRGTGAYQLQASYRDGPVAVATAAALPVTVAVDLGKAPVAAYWLRGQRVRGAVMLTNTGTRPIELDLDTRTSHFAYRATLEKSHITVAPGGRERIPLEVAVAADAWAGNEIQVAVRARGAGGAQRTGLASLVADAGADPVADEPAFPIPASLVGGMDVAAASLGGIVSTTDSDPLAASKRLLHDQMVSSGGLVVPADTLPITLTTRFGLGRAWPIAGIAIHPQVEGRIYPAEQLRDFELLLAEDGEHFESVLSGSLRELPMEQAFALDHPRPARAAQLRLLSNHADNLGSVGLSEWKVITVPGEPAGASLDLADSTRGGHVVWSDPVVGSSPADARALLLDGAPATEMKIVANAQPTFVVGFHEDRAAEIVSLEWRDADATSGRLRFGAIRVAASTDGPLGPWTELGTWDVSKKDAKGAVAWPLPQPTWARFVRFTAATPFPKDGLLQFPRRIRIQERPIDAEHPSILGEWGLMSRDAVFEASRTATPLAPKPTAAATNLTRETAATLSLGQRATGEVRFGAVENWYAVTAPAGVKALTFTASAEPTLDVDVTVEDEHGTALSLRAASVSSRELVLEGRVEPGARYRVRVVEPPRSVAIAYDTSPSIASFALVIYHALLAFADGVVPGHEFVNFMNFEAGFLLDPWSDQPWVLEGALLAKKVETDSSNLEATLVPALGALAQRRGARAMIVVTDAGTPGYPLTADVWRALAQVRPRIFTAHIGNDADPLHEKQIMQDLAAVNGGLCASARTQAEMDVTAERAAALLRRPARYRLTVAESTLPAPAPGTIVVTSAGATAVPVSAPAANAAPSGAIELILDASGSMWQRLEGKPRIQIAHTVLSELVTRTLTKGAPVAFRAFGDDKPGSCETRLVVPLGPLDPKALAKRISGIQPKNEARTPIAASLKAVAADLRDAHGPRTVVLVTDGEETCGGEPKAEIDGLVAQGMDVRVNIVGFAVDDVALKDTFRAWAEAGHGHYFDAKGSGELSKALTAAVSTSFHVTDAAGVVVASGTVGGPAVALPSGIYTVHVDAARATSFEGVVVEPEKPTRLDYRF